MKRLIFKRSVIKKLNWIRAKHELENAESSYDLEKAAKLQHGTIPTLEKELQDLEKSGPARMNGWLKSPLPKMKLQQSLAGKRVFRLLN